MEEEEKLTETELREDAEYYLNKLSLRSEFTMFISVPLLLLMAYMEYSSFHYLYQAIFIAILCVYVVIMCVLRCRSIKSIDFQCSSLQEIANRMKVLKKRETNGKYVACGCLLTWLIAISFLNWGFGLKSYIMIIVYVLIAAYLLFMRSRKKFDGDFDDMISQLENYQQTDL